MINKLKKHTWLLMIILTLIIYWYINSFFAINSLNKYGEHIFYVPMGEFIRQSLNEGFFPHWIPYYYGGTPFFAYAQNMFFKIFTLISLITPSIESNIKLELMIMMVIVSFSMYFLMLELKVKPKFAVISSLVYLLNPFSIRRFLYGDEILYAYIWIPLIFLLTIKSLKQTTYKKEILYSILTGIAFSLQFHSGYPASFMYTVLLFCMFLFFYTLTNLFNVGIIKKVLISGSVVLVITLGLCAIKILPLMEFSKYTSLGMPRTFEDARGSYFEISGLKDMLKPFMFLIDRNLIVIGSFDQIAVGIIPFVFMLFSLARIRNKYVLFSCISLIIIFMIASGSFLFYFLWKYAIGFDRQHHIGRILMMAPLLCSILAGIGAQNFFENIERKFKRLAEKKTNTILILTLIILMLLNFGFFTAKQEYGATKGEFKLKYIIDENNLLQYLSKEDDIFRIHNIKTINVGSVAVIYAVPLKLEIIHGAVNVWIPEYLNEYLWTYSIFAPYKFLGMLNTKYIYSDERINSSELTFVREFDKCKSCREMWPNESEDGPYLYYNKKYLPRVYTAKNAILVAGNYKEAKKIMYFLMVNANFNPVSIVIIMLDKSIDDVALDFLKKFEIIALAEGSIGPNSIRKLQEYKSHGGILVPDILENKNQISKMEIDNLLASFNDSYEDVGKLKIENYMPNGYKVITNFTKGFLVLSEKFFMFKSWKAESNKDSKQILRANGINSAIYLDGDEEYIQLQYSSKTFRNGATTSLITLMGILSYLIYFFKR